MEKSPSATQGFCWFLGSLLSRNMILASVLLFRWAPQRHSYNITLASPTSWRRVLVTGCITYMSTSQCSQICPSRVALPIDISVASATATWTSSRPAWAVLSKPACWKFKAFLPRSCLQQVALPFFSDDSKRLLPLWNCVYFSTRRIWCNWCITDLRSLRILTVCPYNQDVTVRQIELKTWKTTLTQNTYA